MKRKTIGVLGLGIFGRTVADQLSRFEQDVIAVDTNESHVNKIANIVTKAAIGDMTDYQFLESVGIDQCDMVVIATGNNLEASAIAIMNCKKLGITTIIAKAKSHSYEEVLYGIGATRVISPERESGKQVASNILKNKIEKIINLEQGISMVSFKVPDSWIGKTLTQLDVRREFGLNIIGTKHDKEASINPNVDPEIPLEADLIISAVANDRTFEKLDYLGYLK